VDSGHSVTAGFGSITLHCARAFSSYSYSTPRVILDVLNEGAAKTSSPTYLVLDCLVSSARPLSAQYRNVYLDVYCQNLLVEVTHGACVLGKHCTAKAPDWWLRLRKAIETAILTSRVLRNTGHFDGIHACLFVGIPCLQFLYQLNQRVRWEGRE
jgi:hypothetical protein